ncbi:hypothetical protein PV367_29800 [Streptomyces europaeiscabiei]|uniref:Uncharacterized protein n=1 Tax=Streptomyces europaeiscabiei TaxID=146819 RepID=A0AAJ2PUZ6_9ACTN|nr:hypothetical protein [Streptomyces europaeiscabiei]MDX3133884.1 hypothetical protein [Streptomyces europaeiscabiei]
MSETTQPLYGAAAREVGMTVREAATPSEAKSAALLAFEAECNALEALSMKREEWRYLDAKLTALLQRQFEGDDSELTRQRVSRLEALQACLCGSPEALAQEQPPRPRHRA